MVHRDTRRTFAELDADANRVANALAERGVVRNQRVAIYSHNSYVFVVAYFALARLGAISVPVNFNFVASEVRYVLEDSGSTAAIVEDALVDTLEAAEVALSLGVVIGHRPGWTSSTGSWSTTTPPRPTSRSATTTRCSCSTRAAPRRRPKGAIMTNRNLIAQYVSDIVDGEYHRDDVELHALPLYHCAALHDFLTPDVYLGATSVIVDAADPELILRTVEAEGITKMFCPPTVWIRLLRSPSFDRHDLSSLRKGYYGAAIMPVAVLEELGRRLPGVRLFNYYGQTELAPNATVLFPEEQIAKAGTAGRPSLNVEIRLHDEDDRPVPVGQVGEIVHRTPHVMRGYWGKPEATAEVFRHGWFHSGDLGVMDADGYLTIVDRKKDIIITGGENVASREVEDAIYSHPAVSEVAVFGVKHPEWIEAVAAAVVLRDGETATGTEIVAHARERLAGFKSPKYVGSSRSCRRTPAARSSSANCGTPTRGSPTPRRRRDVEGSRVVRLVRDGRVVGLLLEVDPDRPVLDLARVGRDRVHGRDARGDARVQVEARVVGRADERVVLLQVALVERLLLVGAGVVHGHRLVLVEPDDADRLPAHLDDHHVALVELVVVRHCFPGHGGGPLRIVRGRTQFAGRRDRGAGAEPRTSIQPLRTRAGRTGWGWWAGPRTMRPSRRSNTEKCSGQVTVQSSVSPRCTACRRGCTRRRSC